MSHQNFFIYQCLPHSSIFIKPKIKVKFWWRQSCFSALYTSGIRQICDLQLYTRNDRRGSHSTMEHTCIILTAIFAREQAAPWLSSSILKEHLRNNWPRFFLQSSGSPVITMNKTQCTNPTKGKSPIGLILTWPTNLRDGRDLYASYLIPVPSSH